MLTKHWRESKCQIWRLYSIPSPSFWRLRGRSTEKKTASILSSSHVQRDVKAILDLLRKSTHALLVPASLLEGSFHSGTSGRSSFT